MPGFIITPENAATVVPEINAAVARLNRKPRRETMSDNIAAARDWFDRQRAQFAQVLTDGQNIFETTPTHDARKFLEAVDWANSFAHKLVALELCQRVLNLMGDGDDFQTAFLKIHSAACTRLRRNDYRESSTSASDRFLASQRREGDAYFVDAMEAIIHELSRD